MQFYIRSTPKTNALLASRIRAGRLLDVGGAEMPSRAALLAENGCETFLLDIRKPAWTLPPELKLIMKPVEKLDESDGLFDHILLSNVLEHLQSPGLALKRCSERLAPGGCVHILSPNCESLNRRIGLKMGILKSLRDISGYERSLGHLHAFTVSEMKGLVAAAGLKELECFGTQLKPVPTPEIMQWPSERIDAFLDIAPEMPVEICHEFYLRAGKD